MPTNSKVFEVDDPPVEPENLTVVRVRTTTWNTSKGVFLKKSLTFLKRKSRGWNILEEGCAEIGPEDVVSRIINLNNVQDGLYSVVVCNESRDFETGYIDDCDYMLVEAEDEDPYR